MKTYPWPGNIRELENLVERLVIVKGSGVADADGSAAADPHAARVRPPAARWCPISPTTGADLKTMLEAVEENMIGEALVRTNGNKNRAAELLGLNRTTLVEKLRRRKTTNPQA